MRSVWPKSLIAVLLILIFCASCTERTVDKIHVGADYCDHCKMQITDRRFGGALLTKPGKTLKYDSVECLAHGRHDHSEDMSELYVVDYETQSLVPISKIKLYRDDKVRGPMGSKIQGSLKSRPLPSVKIEDIPI